MTQEELKATTAYKLTTNTEDSDVYIHNDEFGCGGDEVEVYLKSEADRYIGELKGTIAQLEDDVAFWRSDARRRYSKGRLHDRYKRCLAMARRCHNESLWWYSKGYGFEKYDKFWEKWEKRWLELAEKFKEAK